MSKLIRRIEQLGKNEGPRIGFGLRQSSSNPPSMVLIATTKTESIKKIDVSNYPVDALVLIQNSNKKNTPFEIASDSIVIGLQTENIDINSIKNNIDFILINDHTIELEQLNKEDLGKILVISEKFLKDQVSGLETLPVDAILLSESLTTPITLEKLLNISALRSDINLPFLVKLERKPSKWELDCLNEIGVQGIVADISNITQEEFTEISNNLKISKKRKPHKQNSNSPLLPSSTSSEESNDDYDDDDNEYEDII